VEQRTPAPPDTPTSLSIGELSERTGVPATTLRYYDELVFLREIGFSLAEIGCFLTGERQSRRQLIDDKLAELAEQQHRIEVARAALEHGKRCPAGEPRQCPRFWSIIEGRLRGLSVEESHARAH
jgi:DNA-binding transcriptional MerR regulator